MEEGEGAAEAAITAKMRHQDYAGARTLLLETLQTNPWLESAVEMLYVLEVLCAAGEAHPGRGVDWYRVLQVLPGDADARIEAQYRNIVAHVEPVAGDLPGAGSALRLVNEAYAVLSDPDKRARFNSRDKFAEFVISVGFDRPTVDNKAVDSRGKLNGLHTKDIRTLDVTNKAITNVQHINNSCSDRRNSHLSNVASSSKPKTMDPGFHGDDVESHFASSSRVKRMDPCFHGDNDELLSPDNNPIDKKKKSVCDTDVHCVSPSQVEFDGCIADLSDAKENGQCSSKQYDYHNFQDDRAIECFAVGQVWAAYDWDKFPRRYALITEVLTDKMQLYVSWFKPCPQSHEENKWSRAGLPFVCGTFVVEECRISLTCPTMFSHQIYSDNISQHIHVYPQKGEVWAIYSDWDIGWCSDSVMWKKSAFSVVEILTSYSKESGCTIAHLVKVNGYRSVFRRYLNYGTVHSENLLMFSHSIPSFRLTHEVGAMFELEHSAVPENRPDQNTLACAVPLTRLSGFHSDTNGSSEAAVAQFSNLSSSNMDLGAPQQEMMYYNNKFSPEDFREGQIWAVFDSRDRMPRSYVRIIHMVSCTSVFVLKLEPHPMLIEEIRWVEDGLPVACGVFRAGTETTYKDIWEFSHPVECDWSAKRSFYKIFPKKGEIWTMYKNWNITLNSSDIDKCEPRMVEILSDYSDENGVNACRLARINGCLTFFHRVLMEGFHLTKWISRGCPEFLLDEMMCSSPAFSRKKKGCPEYPFQTCIKGRRLCTVLQTINNEKESSRGDATMEHGGEEEDRWTESSKSSLSASSDTTVSSAASKQQALRLAEDLSMPSVQVVVMSANMGCSHCRQRVADVVSKMNGLLDYMVDFGKKEVTVRGKVHTKKKKTHKNGLAGYWDKKSPSSSPRRTTRTLSSFLGCYSS